MEQYLLSKQGIFNLRYISDILLQTEDEVSKIIFIRPHERMDDIEIKYNQYGKSGGDLRVIMKGISDGLPLIELIYG
jgi:hypothetical protein